MRHILSLIGSTIDKAYAQVSFFSCGGLGGGGGECNEFIEIYSAPFGACGSGVAFIVELACRGITIVLTVIGAACVLMLTLATGDLIMSGIGSDKKEAAKKTMITTILGLMWVILSGAVVRFVADVVVDMV